MFSIFKTKKKKSQNLLCIFYVAQNWFNVYLADVSQNEVAILDTKENVAYQNQTSLLDAADKCLYEFEEKIKKTLTKSLFIVPTSGSKDGILKEPYATNILQLNKFLELEALGFIEYLALYETLISNNIYVELGRDALYAFKKTNNDFVQIAKSTNLTDYTQTLEDIIPNNSNVFFVCTTHELQSLKSQFNFNFVEPPADITPLIEAVTLNQLYPQKAEMSPSSPQLGAPAQQELAQAINPQTQVAQTSNGLQIYHEGKDLDDLVFFTEDNEPKQESLQVAQPEPEPNPASTISSSEPDFEPNIAKKANWLKYVFYALPIVFLVVLFTAHEIFIHKLEINITKTQEYKKLTQNTQVDPKIVFTKTLSITKTAPATGTAITGDYSRGKITIFNFTDQEATLAAHTKLYTGDLKYEILQDVTIPASKINDAEDAKVAGKTETILEATFLGEEGNLKKDTTFTVSDFPKSNIYAKSTEVIAGGSKQTVTAVGQADIANIKKEILKQAEVQVAESLKMADKVLLTNLATLTITSIKYTPNQGVSAKTLSADAEVLYEAPYIEYSKVASELKAKNIRIDFPGDLKIDVANASTEPKQDVFDATLNVYVPSYIDKNIDLSKYSSPLQSTVLNAIKTNLKPTKIDVKNSCMLPFCNLFLPLNKKNISIKITSN